MAPKRRRGVIDLSSSGGSDIDGSDDDVQCTQFPSMGSDSYVLLSDSQDDCSSGYSSYDQELYEKCVRDLKKIKEMKMRLKAVMRHKSKKKKTEKKTKDGFTRFSPTAFMKVISALSPEKKDVIESYGFGSLLKFSKCFVPNKFANWVAHLVDPKSGDIIRDGKVISLTEESVQWVLDIPNGKRPFPSDPSVGRDLVLSKFGKDRIPPVSFFAEKLIKKEDLSDEDLFICFMIVALASFLCPNTNVVPSPKYFGVFEDIDHIKDFNWCGYVLEWLLDHIKAFNRSKTDKLKRCQGLGGCLFYLAVVYLDHIDFRQRQVPQFIPRISVWKEDMIQFYSNLDLISPGVYGYRPLVDFEKTCYYKYVRVSPTSVDDLDVEFFSNMERVSGCELPLSLKVEISRIINEHCFDCGSSFSMDFNSLGNVSKEFQDMFTKMMRHICRTDSRSKNLVLCVVEAIAKSVSSVSDGNDVDVDVRPENVSPPLSGSDRENVNVVFPKVSGNTCVPSSSKPGQKKADTVVVDDIIDVPFNDDAPGIQNNKSAVLSQRAKFAGGTSARKVSGVSVRNPLQNISNAAHHSVGRDNFVDVERDVINVDKENLVVPDSVSPSPFRHRSKLFHSKMAQSSQNGSMNNRDEDRFIMQTIPFTEDLSPRITPNLSKKSSSLTVLSSGGKNGERSGARGKDNSPVVCTGSRSFLESIRSKTKKSDELYDSNLDKLRLSKESSHLTLSKTHGFPADSSIEPQNLANRSDFKVSDSSTGGKVPAHGPRRMVVPNRALIDDFICNETQFKPLASEIQNYKAICALASSRYSNLDALYFGGVRCTYWSLGESMKFGGKVNNFVVAAFCYHLFCRPDGHPDISKRHYFFPNISDMLMRDHDEVNVDTMTKAFERSAKARPLYKTDLLYFPTFYEDHWFVFVVDIKDMKFVFLDPLYSEDHSYHQFVSSKMIPEFQFWWKKFIKHDMKFKDFRLQYPAVPKMSPYDSVDSGIYAMMFLEHWKSPRSSMCSLFSADDIPNIRIKLSNDMFFNPRNTGKKDPVITYEHEEDADSD